MKIQIKNRFNDAVIFETDAETLGAAVDAAITVKANLSCAKLSGANLSGANLSGANLSCADLYGADLSCADLSGAYLSGAYLYGAYLSSANLSGAKLSGANLSGANLSCADLSCADLSCANLYGADLSCAKLSSANLSCANLYGADLSGAENWEHLLPARTIVPEGELIGWKRLQAGIICKLKIPADAKRICGLIGRKCRAEFAVVLEGKGFSQHNGMAYVPGETVRPHSFDPDPRVECSHGIHFFITREEAEDY